MISEVVANLEVLEAQGAVVREERDGIPAVPASNVIR